MTVTWNGVTNPTTHDWIGLYHPGDANTAYSVWAWDSSCTQVAGNVAKNSGSCAFTMSVPAGTYEFRLFSNDSYTRLATSSTVTVTSTASLGASPASVSGGGAVTVSWNGVTNPTTHDWIGIYHPGDANSAYSVWAWDSSCTQVAGNVAKTSGSCAFTMSEPGTYEFRLFSNDSYTRLATSSTVTVTSTASLSASPASVSGGGAVTVTWNGVTNPTTHDWIGLYHPGDANSAFSLWAWDSSCTQVAGNVAKTSGSCAFTMSVPAGTYEFRLFSNDSYTRLATSSTVIVTSTASLGASPSSVSGGGAVTVTWSGVTNPTTHDWIGLYHPGDANSAFSLWAWDSSCTQVAGNVAKNSGSCAFTMSVPAGTYEFRLFSNDSYTRLATSSTVIVG